MQREENCHEWFYLQYGMQCFIIMSKTYDLPGSGNLPRYDPQQS